MELANIRFSHVLNGRVYVYYRSSSYPVFARDCRHYVNVCNKNKKCVKGISNSITCTLRTPVYCAHRTAVSGHKFKHHIRILRHVLMQKHIFTILWLKITTENILRQETKLQRNVEN